MSVRARASIDIPSLHMCTLQYVILLIIPPMKSSDCVLVAQNALQIENCSVSWVVLNDFRGRMFIFSAGGEKKKIE